MDAPIRTKTGLKVRVATTQTQKNASRIFCCWKQVQPVSLVILRKSISENHFASSPADNFSHTCISCSLLLLVLALVVVQNSGPKEFIRFPEKPDFPHHHTTSKNSNKKEGTYERICFIMIMSWECSLVRWWKTSTNNVYFFCVRYENLVWRLNLNSDMQVNILWREGSGNSCCFFKK